MNQKPEVKVALGWSPETIKARSSMDIHFNLPETRFAAERVGGAFIKEPHRFIYQDENLFISFDNAGNGLPRMPSVISILHDQADIVRVSALGHYVTLEEAIETSKLLLNEFKEQGFEYRPHDPAKGPFSRFRLTDYNALGVPEPPRLVDGFEGMRQAFLNSHYFVKEFLVFAFQKNKVNVSLRVVNMRRKYEMESITDKGKAKEELREVKPENLITEKVYFLQVTIFREYEAESRNK